MQLGPLGSRPRTWNACIAPNGDLVREPSFVVELVHVATPDVEVRVQHVMAEYKLRFAQQSVLRLVTTAWTGL